MEYKAIKPIGIEAATMMLSSKNAALIIDALLRAVESIEDWHWLQDTCLRFVDDDDVWIARTAIICLGHIARIWGKLDKEKVLDKLAALKAKPELLGHIESAEDDIYCFLKAR